MYPEEIDAFALASAVFATITGARMPSIEEAAAVIAMTVTVIAAVGSVYTRIVRLEAAVSANTKQLSVIDQDMNLLADRIHKIERDRAVIERVHRIETRLEASLASIDARLGSIETAVKHEDKHA